jgi:hypothetical protein
MSHITTLTENFDFELNHASYFLIPHIRGLMGDIRNRENYDTLWEYEYSRVIAAILDFYFHSTNNNNWVIAPEYNIGENHNPDYTIFNIHLNPFRDQLIGCFELKRRNGDSWHSLLTQISLALESNNVGRVWLVGVKGLTICFYIFDVETFINQRPECFDFLEVLNLNKLGEDELVRIGAKYETCDNDGYDRIALIKWELDNVNLAPYIDHMFQYMRSRMP